MKTGRNSQRDSRENFNLASSVNSQIVSKDDGSAYETTDQNQYYFFGNCPVDHSSRQFVCIHEQCHEHNSCFRNQQLDENIDYHALSFHPDDRSVWCEKAYPDILRFVNSAPVQELTDFRFLFNHRYIQRDGAVLQFLHEGTISLKEDLDLPVIKLNVFTELGDFKSDDTMILSVFKYSSNHGFQKVLTKVYGKTTDSQLSHREIEIIKLCLEGLSSKMIADKLNLSIHTVKNHKRNCMEKTLTHNIAELINLCMTKQWL